MREARFTVAQRTRQWRVFRGHWREQYQIVALTPGVHTTAERLLFSHPLRAYDALQIASALALAAAAPSLELHFLTADRQQATAAQAEGLSVTLVT